jgi:hypothetical protein
MKTENSKKMTLSRRQAQVLVKQIASLCEKAYRRGVEQAVALKPSPEDASWYRYHCVDKFRGQAFHLIAHRMPEPFTPEQTKDWPKADQHNPGRSYARNSIATAVSVHRLNYGNNSTAYAELHELAVFAGLP